MRGARGLAPGAAGDLDLSWGNGETMVELLHWIAHRQGIGDLLAEGTRIAAERTGGDSYQWAVQANGLEQSRVDTRVAKAYSLAFAVNPRGPDHLHAQPMAEFGHFPEARELVKRILGREEECTGTTLKGKPELVRWHEDMFALTDSLGICSFATTSSYIVSLESLALMVSAALGVEMSGEELLERGRRCVVLERCFNLREKPNRKDELPWRLMNEPISEGPLAGHVNSAQELGGLLRQYYRLQGYDLETGRPTRELLGRLELAEGVKGLDDWAQTLP